MINKLIEFSIRNKFIIGIFIIALIGWGAYSLKHINIDAVPDVTNNQVQIITQSPNLAAQEVEQFITTPIELHMQNVPGVIEVRSISRFGLSVVTVVFKEETSIYLARQLVDEKLKEVEGEIPEGFGTPEKAPISTGLGEVYQYVIQPKEGYEEQYDAMDIRTIQDWIVKRQLAGIEGVVEVNSFGGYLKQYEVAVNPEKLKSLNVTIGEVFEALSKNNQNSGGSYIENGKNTHFIRGIGMAQSIDDIKKIPVKTRNGIPIRIEHVAKVHYGHAPRFGALTYNGQGETSGGMVLMMKGENSAEVVNRVKERIARIQNNLPEGLEIIPFADRTKLIDKTIHTVSTNLIEGGLIVIFILVFFLGNIRAGLVVASVIPLSMLFAISLMNLFGVSANLMSLGALDFGIIVDGAVIIVEAIVHRLVLRRAGHHLTQEEMDNEVRDGASKIRKSAAFGEIIILIVYLPILALVGIEGKMFKPMALTVSFAILGAFLLSLTYVPMMTALVMRKKVRDKKTFSDRMISFIQKGYDPIIKMALRFKYAILTVTVGLFISSLLTFNNMGGVFIPRLEEGDLVVNFGLKPGTSLDEAIATATKIEKAFLEKFPEVLQVCTKIGTSEIPTDPHPMETGDIFVVLDDKENWVSANNQADLIKLMKKEIRHLPGVNIEFSQPIEHMFNTLISGVRSDIAIKIYGNDLNVLHTKATELSNLIADINGVGDVKVEQTVGLPQIAVKYNYDALGKYDVDIEHLNNTLSMAFGGTSSGVIAEYERKFDLVVRLDKAFRKDIDHVKNLYVDLPNGTQIPLEKLAEVKYIKSPMQISRDNANRRIVIGVNVRNRDVESLIEEIKTKLNSDLKLDPGYYITYGGQFENLKSAKERLAVAVPIALALIFVLLFFTFHSVKQALLIFTAIPLSAIGGVSALWLRQMPFSISAGIGFIALFGVAVLNGIVLIAYFNQLKKEGMTDIYERILVGTKTRLRPVIMTASVAALGFLPMALSTTAGGEVQRPLATVVIGGLISATLLTLVVLPVLYLIFDKVEFKPGKKAMLFIGFLMVGGLGSVQSQDNSVTMDQAVDLALKNHPSIKAGQLNVEKHEELQKTGFSLDPTQFSYTNGNINSGAIDYQIQVNQSFKFPTVYGANKQLLVEETKLSESDLLIRQSELKKQVRMAFSDLSFHKENLKEYTNLKEVYLEFSDVANKRFEAGATNLLEKLAAEAKYQNILLLVQEEETKIAGGKERLKKLMGVSNDFDITIVQEASLTSTDSSAIKNHPSLLYLQQVEQQNLANTKTLKQAYIPEFNVGYFNQQIDLERGFQGFQVGVNVPLFYRADKAQVQASKMNQDIILQEYKDRELQLQSEFAQYWSLFQLHQSKSEYYQTTGSQLRDQLYSHAQTAYKEGEIDYVEYIEIMDQASELTLKELENKYAQQSIINELKYLIGQ